MSVCLSTTPFPDNFISQEGVIVMCYTEGINVSEEEDKRIWKRILILRVRRYCENCCKDFYCSGNCPEGRWSHGTLAEAPNWACFCRECLRKSTSLKFTYVQKRMEVCY